jgi:hypothetical protein
VVKLLEEEAVGLLGVRHLHRTAAPTRPTFGGQRLITMLPGYWQTPYSMSPYLHFLIYSSRRDRSLCMTIEPIKMITTTTATRLVCSF